MRRPVLQAGYTLCPSMKVCDTPRPKENSSTVGHTGRTFPLDFFFFSVCVRNKAGAQGPELGSALTQVRTQGFLIRNRDQGGSLLCSCRKKKNPTWKFMRMVGCL